MAKLLTKKVFFYYEDITSGVFDSQVLHHICLMKRCNHEFILINFIPLKFFLTRFYIYIKKINLIKKKGVRCIYFLTINPIKLHGQMINTFYSFVLAVLFKIYNIIGYYVIIHARGIHSTLIGASIKKLGINCRLIFDMRAEKVSEYKYEFQMNGTNLKHRHLLDIDKIQSKAVRNCDVCLMVSNALKEYIIEKYKFTPNPYYIIPSVGRSDIFFFDSNIRIYMRKSLNLENKFVIGYSGSMRSWQRIDKALEAFVYISQMRENTVLLILTKEIAEAEKIFKKYIKNSAVIIKRIEHEKLGKYLQCFDVGIILRDKLLLNRVASPTKFAEYILCGVPVFMSTGIGDLEKVVKQQNLGVCIENFDDKDEFKTKAKDLLNCNFNRSEIAEYAKKKFGREAYVDIYNEIYANSTRIR